MNTKHTLALLGSALLVGAACLPAQAQVRITEVSAWGSGSTSYGSDWFELTNFGSGAVDISGWTMDDNSNGSAKVALTGITSIAAGESVIFTENAVTAGFLSAWFGASAPAGLKIGNYTGSGVGLSTSGDAVNVFDATGTLVAKVTFGASPGAAPFASFDNAAALNNTAISQLSVAGVNGAFLAADGIEIGSPGSIAAVPEPVTSALMLGGLGLLAAARRRAR